MHPELFTIPIVGISVKTYGFCLMVGFLSAVWLAMRRATRVKADPDRVLDVSFLSLFFGVAGARLFYVAHYWKSDFAFRSDILFAIVDIRQGGLEFLGGFFGAFAAILVYLSIKRLSVRLFLDILAPAVMWGLAFGRIGCFFNGCCFGGLCVTAPNDAPRYAWAVQFPYGSPAYSQQWENRKITVPAELITTRHGEAALLPASALNLTVEQRERPAEQVRELKRLLTRAKASDPTSQATKELESQLRSAQAAYEAHKRQKHLDDLEFAQKMPSRQNAERQTSVTELEQMAAQQKSLPVHPTQIYSAIHALILSCLLGAVFHIRKRHGTVMGLLMVLYPFGRILLELIRADNPRDTAGLTISQFVSLAMFVAGVIYLVALFRFMPERSPRLAVSK